ncbi:MAG: leucine-rich repeat domain-containing protein [Treponema sp.]|jgi:hypothetical protein|nr:leucine-rich repeat domain-containing protein [Treponema sp.]
MKKLLAAFLYTVLLITACTSTQNTHNQENNPATGELVTKGDYMLRGTVLAKYQGKDQRVIIPTYLGITAIGDGAFADRSDITTITIPEGITAIGGRAFAGCTRLSAITVNPANRAYRDIEGVLFDYYGETLVSYPGGKIETAYSIPERTARIGDWAFFECPNLASVSIPESVTSIGKFPLYGCENFVFFTVASRNKLFSVRSGVLFDKTGRTLVVYPQGRRNTSYNIPSGVSHIGEGAFAGCRYLYSLALPEGIETIGNYAFFGCTDLAIVLLPKTLAAIGDAVFWDSGISSIIIPAGVRFIGKGALGSPCLSIIEVDIRSPYFIVQNGALYDRQITTLIRVPPVNMQTRFMVPDSVGQIEDYAFYGCRLLREVALPSKLQIPKSGNIAYTL